MGESGMGRLLMSFGVMVVKQRHGGATGARQSPVVLPTSLTKLSRPLSSATTIFWLVKSKTGPVSLRPLFTLIGQGDPASAGVPLNTPVIFHNWPLSSPT